MLFTVLQKQTEVIFEYYFRFQFGNRRHQQSNHCCLFIPSHRKIESEFTRKIMEQILTVQYTA